RSRRVGWRRRCGVRAALVFAVGLGGCASTGPSVRALRMYKEQEATPSSLHAHITQMGDALAAINTLLYQTQYVPGASWVGELPLDATTRPQAEALSTEPSCRDSFVCVYTAHVRNVLGRSSQVVAIPAGAPGLPVFPSVHAALAEVHPALGGGADVIAKLSQELAGVDARLAALQQSPTADPGA